MTTWKKEWTPISPQRDEDGHLRAIRELLGPSVNAAPVPLSTGTSADLKVEMVSSYMSMSLAVASAMSIGNYVDASANFHEKIHVFDFAVGRFESFDEPVLPVDQVITATFWGMSLRVLFRVRLLDVGANVDAEAGPVSFAAAVELGRATVEFQADSICSDPLVFAAVLEGIPLTGKFDIQAYTRFSAKVLEAQRMMLSVAGSDPTRLSPIGVRLSERTDERSFLDEAKSIRWALAQMEGGRTLTKALLMHPAEIDKSVVEATYRYRLGGDGTKSISASDASWAKRELY